MKSEKVYIIGAGGHGQVVAEAVMKMGITPAGFLDDDNALFGKKIIGIPVIGRIEICSNLDGKFVVAIGDNLTRKRIVDHIKLPEEKYFTVIHPSAVIGKNVKIGAGAMIIGGAVINTETRIGNHTIINTSSSVDHHNTVGDFVHIAPGVHTGGNVKIGEGAFIGIGTSVIPGIEIGEWAIVGAGAVVVKDLPGETLSVGVPAHIVRRLK